MEMAVAVVGVVETIGAGVEAARPLPALRMMGSVTTATSIRKAVYVSVDR
jgi:hypothetical protein